MDIDRTHHVVLQIDPEWMETLAAGMEAMRLNGPIPGRTQMAAKIDRATSGYPTLLPLGGGPPAILKESRRDLEARSA